jgi:cell division protein FtsB
VRDSAAAKAADRAARERRSALTGRAAILALVLAALIVSYASSLRAWSEQQARLADLRAEASDRGQRVADLEQELDRWRDPAYVEAQARQRFGWVMPGEVGYVVVDENDPAPSGASSGAAGGSIGRQPVWWRDLWGSVEQAGAPPKPERSTKPKPATTIDPERSTKPPESR